MRRLLVHRTLSVREKEQLAAMAEAHEGGGGGGGSGSGEGHSGVSAPLPPPLPPAAAARSTLAPPAPRARMPLICRIAALVAAAFGLYAILALVAAAAAALAAAAAAHPDAARWLLACYLNSELLFLLTQWLPRYEQVSRAPPPHYPSRAESLAQFERVLALRGRLRSAAATKAGSPPSSPRSAAARTQAERERERADVEQYLSGWFRGCDASKVRRGNVADLLSMGFFFHSPSSPSPSSSSSSSENANSSSSGAAARPPAPSPAELDEMVTRLERAWGLHFPPGRDPTLKLMDHLNEPLRALPYPWVAYAAIALLAAMSRLVLLAAGFRRHTFRYEKKMKTSEGSGKEGAEGGGGSNNGSNNNGNNNNNNSDSNNNNKYLDLDYYMLRGARRPWSSASSSSSAANNNNNDAAVAAAVAAAAAGPPPAPLIFLHGVGGLFPFYTDLLVRIAAGGSGVLSPNGAFLAVEFKNVSLRFARAGSPLPPTASELAEAVAALAAHVEAQQHRHYHEQLALLFAAAAAAASPLNQPPPAHPHHHPTGSVFVAHSYGTLVAARLVRAHRSSVCSLVLIDPVVFGMFLPQLLGAFVYGTARPHHYPNPNDEGAAAAARRRRRPLAASLRLLGLRLLSREVTLAATMSRAFYWSEMNLWPEDCPDGTVVVLGGRDELLDAPQVLAMLESAGDGSVGGVGVGGVGAGVGSVAPPAAAAAAAVTAHPLHHHLEVVAEEDLDATPAPSSPSSAGVGGPLAFLFPPPPPTPPPPAASSSSAAAAAVPPQEPLYPHPNHPRIRVMYESDLFHGALLINRSVRAALLSELRAAVLKAAARSLRRVGGALGGAGTALDRRAARASGRAGAAVRRTRTALADLLAPGPGRSASSFSAAWPPPSTAPAPGGASASPPLAPRYARSFTAGTAPAAALSSEPALLGEADDEGGWTHVSSLEAELRAMMEQRRNNKAAAAAQAVAGGGADADDADEDVGQGC